MSDSSFPFPHLWTGTRSFTIIRWPRAIVRSRKDLRCEASLCPVLPPHLYGLLSRRCCSPRLIFPGGPPSALGADPRYAQEGGDGGDAGYPRYRTPSSIGRGACDSRARPVVAAWYADSNTWFPAALGRCCSRALPCFGSGNPLRQATGPVPPREMRPDDLLVRSKGYVASPEHVRNKWQGSLVQRPSSPRAGRFGRPPHRLSPRQVPEEKHASPLPDDRPGTSSLVEPAC